ncbi:peptide-N(4)-(N-acetyl-beta-glucosaminyl)asparagine amidase [Trichomonascus vanleenenianus]|uniref:peptide-N4-(N-acetyl-beta- glucosaminyl)asparagine amidase n=1 Tax=Trichomonascus vanleenenianus TaxID=2268995 RepID=UPI003ECB89D8
MDPAALARLVGQKYRQYVSHKSPSPFAGQLERLSETPLAYENGDLLDRALEVMPLERLFGESDRRAAEDATWGSQDYLVMELLKWFKHDFFTWVNSPQCPQCHGETSGMGGTAPSPQERADGAGVTELYKCNSCQRIERLPRYGSPGKLLETRRGRCGEWANCFTLLCRALGLRARWVWNSEDHVWTEVYSERQKRWVHCDSCEEAWDKPTLYEKGWGKRMAYCIGFSAEGATDVTRRYVRDKEKALPRDKISEADLVTVLKRITSYRREAIPQDVDRLQAEDKDEQEELASYSATATATTEAVGPRESGAGEWTKARGEDGSS